MKVKAWAQMFRWQTAPATILLLEVPYLASDKATLLGGLLVGIFGWLVHGFSFGQNSLFDSCVIHERGKPPPDLIDPSKAHHPLITGEINLTTAHKVIHWGLAFLVTAGCVGSLLGENPALSAVSLVIWVSYGYAYNQGLSKVTVWAWVPICMCFCGLGGWAWFLSHSELGILGALYLAYVFLCLLFQISFSGNLKEMGMAERSNILAKMGAKLVREWTIPASTATETEIPIRFVPGWARWYGIAVKLANLCVGWMMLCVNYTYFAHVATIFLSLTALWYLHLLTAPRVYNRERELFSMSIEEVVSIYIPLFTLLPWPWAVGLGLVGVLYFFGMNRLLWKKSHPAV